MDNVILLPEGLMVEVSSHDKAMMKIIQPDNLADIIPYLHHRLIIDEECTVEDFLKLFYWTQPLTIHQLEQFVGVPMYEYIEESKLPAKDDDRYPYELMFVEVRNHTMKATVKEYHLETYSIYRYCVGIGVSDSQETEQYDNDDEDDIEIEFTDTEENGLVMFNVGLVPTNNLKILPLQYDPALAYYLDNSLLFETTLDITLLAVIQSMFSTFSEVGSITKRDKLAQELTIDFINPDDEESNYEY